MALYRIKKDYFDKLIADPEFEADAKRLYCIVRQLDYKQKKIAVAIPLRSNINMNFQKNPNEYIVTLPSYKTQKSKGNIAGWHIVKLVPIAYEHVITGKNYSIDIQIAEDIALKYKKQELIDKIKDVLKRIECGEKIFGAIDFDAALAELERLNNKIEDPV